MARTYYVDGEKLKALRTKGGWKDEDIDAFALEADVHPETVKRAERNAKMFKKNIQAFAHVLGLKTWEELLAPRNVQSGLITIEIHFDVSEKHFRKYFTVASLIRQLEEALEVRDDITKLEIRFSSVILRLLCNKDDASIIILSFALGHLDFLRRSIHFLQSDIKWTGHFNVGPSGLTFSDRILGYALAERSEHGLTFAVTRSEWGVQGGWFLNVLEVAEKYPDKLRFDVNDEEVICYLEVPQRVETLSLPTP